MAIRIKERDAILSDPQSLRFEERLMNAVEYPESYKISFEVQNNDSYDECLDFVLKILSMR
jgi:hypothetical protein